MTLKPTKSKLESEPRRKRLDSLTKWLKRERSKPPLKLPVRLKKRQDALLTRESRHTRLPEPAKELLRPRESDSKPKRELPLSRKRRWLSLTPEQNLLRRKDLENKKKGKSRKLDSALRERKIRRKLLRD